MRSDVAAACAMHHREARSSLKSGSRDDSFLSTISEGTSTSTSTDCKSSRDSKMTLLNGSQIEVYAETMAQDLHTHDMLWDFRDLFQSGRSQMNAGQLQQQLREHGLDKPLEMQRRVVPVVMSAFAHEDQKTFITVQGASHCGKTSALALGFLGAVGPELPGICAVVLSTSHEGDFVKYFDIFSDWPLKVVCFGTSTQASAEVEDPDGLDLARLASALADGCPAVIFGHPRRVLALLKGAPPRGIDLGNVQVLALDDTEETIKLGLMDEVCEACTILRHFSRHRLRHIILSHFLTHEATSMIRCLRNSLFRQQNLFGIWAHKAQAKAKSVNHYYAVAPRHKWPAMLAAIHHALSLPSGIIFDDDSQDARIQACEELVGKGVTASVWDAFQKQQIATRSAGRDLGHDHGGPAFHLMPSDLVVLNVDLPQVRCVLHFEVPRRMLSVYGLRLMCLEHNHKKARAGGGGGRRVSVLFVLEVSVVRELEKTFHIKMEEMPTEMLISE